LSLSRKDKKDRATEGENRRAPRFCDADRKERSSRLETSSFQKTTGIRAGAGNALRITEIEDQEKWEAVPSKGRKVMATLPVRKANSYLVNVEDVRDSKRKGELRSNGQKVEICAVRYPHKGSAQGQRREPTRLTEKARFAPSLGTSRLGIGRGVGRSIWR